MNHRERLFDGVLYALEFTLLGHHPAAATAIANAVSHLDLRSEPGRAVALQETSRVLSAYGGTPGQATAIAEHLIDRVVVELDARDAA